MRPTHARAARRTRDRIARLLLAAALFALGMMLPSLATAATRQAARFDMPDWLSEGSAASLNVGIDVLVPSEPPAPFGGEPSISASDGYYNLYWLVGGSPPTFLSITGEAGGTIPAYSKYDRNVELTVNASVNGADAYHDVTPIYDLVYWQVGDVVYSVESQNMTGSDSLSLAESLVVLTPPVQADPTETPPDEANSVPSGGNDSSANGTDNSASSGNSSAGSDANSSDASGNSTAADQSNSSSASDGPSLSAPLAVDAGGTGLVTVSGSNGDTLTADSGIFTATGRDSIIDVADADLEWEAPSPDADQTVTFQLVDPGSGDVVASAQTTVSTDPSRVLTCPASTESSKDVTLLLRGSGVLTLKADMGAFPANGVNADFSSNGGGDSLSGTMPAAGAVQLDWKAPERKTNGTATITVTDENGDSIGTCAIDVAKTAAKATPAAATAAQTSDGTDLKVTGPGAVNPEPSVIASTSGGTIDDGSGILAPMTPAPGSTPTPAATKPPPTATRTATPSVKPTATLAPTLDTSGMVSQVIGPDGGQLSCPSGATISFPAGALDQPSTVTLRPVANAKLPARATVDLLPDTGFDITVASVDGRSIDGLKKPAKFTIALASDKWRSGTTLYAVDGLDMQPLANVTLNGDSVSAPVNLLSRYVAGVPVTPAQGAKRSIAKFVMAGAALVFSVSVAGLAFKIWLGRKSTMSVGPRRLR